MTTLFYSDALQSFGDWFVQLWSESLGKRKSKEGSDVFEGSFPVLGRGASAQHSLLQLLMEGPDSSWIQFIEVEDFETNEKSFQKLIHIEANATMTSLLHQKRPCIKLTLKKLDEEHLGAALYFYECVVALLGLALAINPFDQPGVEDTKKRIKLAMSSL